MQIENDDLSKLLIRRSIEARTAPDEKVILVRGIPAIVKRAWAVRKWIAVKKSFRKEA